MSVRRINMTLKMEDEVSVKMVTDSRDKEDINM